MKAMGRISTAIVGALTGAGAALFLHPREGRRNRSAAVGLARRRSGRVATMFGSRPAHLRGRSSRGDTQVAARVNAELSACHPDVEAVAVTVHRGTVTLRGEVSRLDDIEALELTARSVTGVRDVNNLLRLPANAPAGR